MKRIAIGLFGVGLFLFAQAAQADWSPAKRLTWTTGNSFFPAIAVDPSGHLHVVWEDDASGNYAVYYKKNSDGGATWSGNKRLTWTAGNSLRPDIAVDSAGALHLVWEDDTPGNSQIYYRRSSTGGDNWSSVKTLTSTGAAAGSPVIAVDSSDNLYVSWYASTLEGIDIFLRKSVDGGTSWSTVRRLTWNQGDSRDPALAVDSSANVYVVWDDNAPGSPDVYYRKSGDGGASWSTVRRLTWTSGSSVSVAVAVASPGVINVFWRDDTLGVADEIFAKRSTDGGVNWAGNQRLTWSLGDSLAPAVAADSSGGLHLFWADNFDNYEIYYKKSTSGGASWSTLQRLTWTSASSGWPAIAVDSTDNVHVVWADFTPGNYEIYYKKGT